eukprot:TRINITY_DN3845_c0_g3_i2.p1 TRINITY_DN3845_c0_g3~~TRINITY_DN3845_c0_g3_i2.p1  ORF type:complete len:660 (+),score=273.31 TRINITY_DN3845_c0_g3_i2:122-1981(+)
MKLNRDKLSAREREKEQLLQSPSRSKNKLKQSEDSPFPGIPLRTIAQSELILTNEELKFFANHPAALQVGQIANKRGSNSNNNNIISNKNNYFDKFNKNQNWALFCPWKVSKSSKSCDYLNNIVNKLWRTTIHEILVTYAIPTLIKDIEKKLSHLVKKIDQPIVNLGTKSPIINSFQYKTSTTQSVELILQVELKTDATIIFDVFSVVSHWPIEICDLQFKGEARFTVILPKDCENFWQNIQCSLTLSKQYELDYSVRVLDGSVNLASVPVSKKVLNKIVTKILNNTLIEPNKIRIGPSEEDEEQGKYIVGIQLVTAGQILNGFEIVKSSISQKFSAALPPSNSQFFAVAKSVIGDGITNFEIATLAQIDHNRIFPLYEIDTNHWLCFELGGDLPPLCEFGILVDPDTDGLNTESIKDQLPQGFEKFETNLNINSWPKMFIVYKRTKQIGKFQGTSGVRGVLSKIRSKKYVVGLDVVNKDEQKSGFEVIYCSISGKPASINGNFIAVKRSSVGEAITNLVVCKVNEISNRKILFEIDSNLKLCYENNPEFNPIVQIKIIVNQPNCEPETIPEGYEQLPVNLNKNSTLNIRIIFKREKITEKFELSRRRRLLNKITGSQP